MRKTLICIFVLLISLCGCVQTEATQATEEVVAKRIRTVENATVEKRSLKVLQESLDPPKAPVYVADDYIGVTVDEIRVHFNGQFQVSSDYWEGARYLEDQSGEVPLVFFFMQDGDTVNGNEYVTSIGVKSGGAVSKDFPRDISYSGLITLLAQHPEINFETTTWQDYEDTIVRRIILHLQDMVATYSWEQNGTEEPAEVLVTTYLGKETVLNRIAEIFKATTSLSAEDDAMFTVNYENEEENSFVYVDRYTGEIIPPGNAKADSFYYADMGIAVPAVDALGNTLTVGDRVRVDDKNGIITDIFLENRAEVVFYSELDPLGGAILFYQAQIHTLIDGGTYNEWKARLLRELASGHEVDTTQCTLVMD